MKKIIILLSLLLLSSLSMGYVNINSCQTLNNADTEYRLTSDVSGTDCFPITASGITLDCQGYKITGSITVNKYAVSVQAHNLEIKNCVIEHVHEGFFCGLATSENVSIHNNIIDNSMVNTTYTYALHLATGIGECRNINFYNNEVIATGMYIDLDQGLYPLNIHDNNFSHLQLNCSHVSLVFEIANTQNNYSHRVYDNLFDEYDKFTIGAGDFISWNSSTRGNKYIFDNGSGFSQTCSDTDYNGICDDIRTFNANNKDYLPISMYDPSDSGYSFVLIYRDWDTGVLLTDDLTYVCLKDMDGTHYSCEWTDGGKIRKNWSIDNHTWRMDTQRANYIDEEDTFLFNQNIIKTYYLKSTISGTFVSGIVYNKDTGEKIFNCPVWRDSYYGLENHDAQKTKLNGSYFLHIPTCEPYIISPHCSNYHYDGEQWAWTPETGWLIGELWECNTETQNKTTIINFPMTKTKDFCNLTVLTGSWINENCIKNDTIANGTILMLEGDRFGIFYNFTLLDKNETYEVLCDSYTLKAVKSGYDEHTDTINVENDFIYELCLTELKRCEFIVYVKNSTSALEDATIKLESDDKIYYYKTKKTNSSGYAVFSDTWCPQYYTITVWKAYYDDYSERFPINYNFTKTIILEKSSFIHGFTFKDNKETFLPDVKIILTSGNKTFTTKSGFEGVDFAYYKLNVPSGDYVLEATKTGYYAYYDDITIVESLSYPIVMSSELDFINFAIDVRTGTNCDIPISAFIVLTGVNIEYTEVGNTDATGHYEALIGIPKGKYILDITINKTTGKTFNIEIWNDYYNSFCIQEGEQSQDQIDEDSKELGKGIQALINEWGFMLGGLVLLVIFAFFGSMLFEFMDKIGGKA